MAYIRTPYEELQQWNTSGGLEVLFRGFGAKLEVTNTIPVSAKVLGNLQPIRELNRQNAAIYHPQKVFVPSQEEVYVHGGEYRIAIAAKDIVYGSVSDIDDAFNKEFGYKNFMNVLRFASDERDVKDGYFTLFLGANAKLQRLAKHQR